MEKKGRCMKQSTHISHFTKQADFCWSTWQICVTNFAQGILSSAYKASKPNLIEMPEVRRSIINVTAPLVLEVPLIKSASFYNGEHCNSIIFLLDKNIEVFLLLTFQLHFF